MSLFESSGVNSLQSGLYVAGALSPSLVNSLYPMQELTKWHARNHIVGLTGRWMDKGGTYLTGHGGNFHRLSHGHHLFEDGFKVMVNPKLKFGEFLHHLGLDSLTRRGIPNPLLPTSLQMPLMSMGLEKQFVHDVLTINVPKILGGSLGLICAANDVYMCFSDAIPHTYLAAGTHFLLGAIDIGIGMYPPNILLLAAGVMEVGVGSVTLFRTVCDSLVTSSAVDMTISQSVDALAAATSPVYLPAVGGSLAIGAVLGGAAGWWTGQSWQDVTKSAAISGTSAATSVSVGALAAKAGFIAPFLGAGAGLAAAVLMRAALSSGRTGVPVGYQEYEEMDIPSLFPAPTGLPLFGAPDRPIGRLEGDTLVLDHRALGHSEERLV
jgi:hypothetical protein